MYQASEAINLSIPARLHVMNRERLRRTAYCKVPLQFQTRQFTIKTVDSFDEFLQVMDLRHRVFQKEFAGRKYCLRSDRDAFDSHADFLVAIDNETRRIVGCYRLICSEFSHRFYSATEFDISPLLQLHGAKVELSRACILKEYRNGRIISLLWQGLSRYIEQVNAKYFFGCGSVQSMDPVILAGVSDQFRKLSAVSETLQVSVRKKYQLPSHQQQTVNFRLGDIEIPSLIRAYLKAGAVVCSEPAIDRKFRCADYLILMDRDEIDLAYRQKYLTN